MKYAKFIGAAVVGFLAGGLSVALVQSISNSLYPPPADLDINDSRQLADWVKTLPTMAFLIVVASWSAGAFVGPWLTRRISPGRTAIPATVVWLLFGAATLFTLASIPHPWWMWPSGVGVWLVFGLLGLAVAAPVSTEVFVVRTIAAPIERVFQTVAQPERFCEAIPDIEKIEIVSAIKSGVGTRFRETRNMHGKTAVAEMEVAEYIDNQRFRLIGEMAGTIWDSRFELSKHGPGTQLEMHMIARPKNLFSRLLTPLMIGMVAKAIGGDMDQVKAFCEKSV